MPESNVEQALQVFCNTSVFFFLFPTHCGTCRFQNRAGHPNFKITVHTEKGYRCLKLSFVHPFSVNTFVYSALGSVTIPIAQVVNVWYDVMRSLVGIHM